MPYDIQCLDDGGEWQKFGSPKNPTKEDFRKLTAGLTQKIFIFVMNRIQASFGLPCRILAEALLAATDPG